MKCNPIQTEDFLHFELKKNAPWMNNILDVLIEKYAKL